MLLECSHIYSASDLKRVYFLEKDQFLDLLLLKDLWGNQEVTTGLSSKSSAEWTAAVDVRVLRVKIAEEYHTDKIYLVSTII